MQSEPKDSRTSFQLELASASYKVITVRGSATERGMWGRGRGSEWGPPRGRETATAFDKQGVGHPVSGKGRGEGGGRSISFDSQPTAKDFKCCFCS